MQVRVHTDPPVERRAFGAAVRELRGRRGLSLPQLAARAQVHDGYLRAVERADVEAGLRTMGRIAAGLGVALSTLMVCAERRLGARRAGDGGAGGGPGASGHEPRGGRGGDEDGAGGREPRGGRG